MSLGTKNESSDFVPAIAGGLVLAGIVYGGSKFYRGIREHTPLNSRQPKVPSQQEHVAQMTSIGSLENPANKLPVTTFAGTKIPVGRIPFNESPTSFYTAHSSTSSSSYYTPSEITSFIK